MPWQQSGGEPPPLPPWAVYTAGATSGALAVAAGGALVGSVAFWRAHQSLAQRAISEASLEDPVDGAELKRREDYSINFMMTAGAFLGAATLAGLTAGLMSLFTDWQGYGEEVEEM